ncbi:MAG: hypothetical protein ACRDZU_00130 [Acidimicrobiales bacterium]
MRSTGSSGSSPRSTRRLSWPAPIRTGVRGSTTEAPSTRLDCSVKSRDRRHPTYNRSIEILLLCTANQCRSPMADALLRHRLGPVDPTVSVSSAGLYPGGRPATPHGVAVMADRGLDLLPHRSRQLGPELLRGADLVIGMAREHVREVAVLESSAVDRTFTLKELVRMAEANGGRRSAEPIGDWLSRISVNRRREALLGVGHDDDYDIADPIGRDRADYEATADEIDDLLGRFVALAWSAPAIQHGQERSA